MGSVEKHAALSFHIQVFVSHAAVGNLNPSKDKFVTVTKMAAVANKLG